MEGHSNDPPGSLISTISGTNLESENELQKGSRNYPKEKSTPKGPKKQEETQNDDPINAIVVKTEHIIEVSPDCPSAENGTNGEYNSQVTKLIGNIENISKKSKSKNLKKKELTKMRKFKSKLVHFIKESRFAGLPLALGKQTNDLQFLTI